MNQAAPTRPQSRLHARYGPWAVVTGASSGIGEEFARRLGRHGFNLVLVARRKNELDKLATDLMNELGIQTRTLALDLGPTEAAETLVNATTDLDVGLLVCSAGFGSSGALIDSDLRAETAMVDLNCRALLSHAFHFGKRFVAQRRGGIILLSSLVAFQGVPRAANYSATKAYVQSLAEGLHHELAPFGVDVQACAPGPIHSGFAARARMTMGMAQRPAAVAQASLNMLGRRTTVRPGLLSKGLELALKPLPRWGRVRMMGVVMKGMAARGFERAPFLPPTPDTEIT